LTDYSTSDISGNNSYNITLGELLKNNDIVVLTAQILVNALKDNTVSISQTSLLLFDECHHTNGDEPYNRIMQAYLSLKLEKNNKEELPQVILYQDNTSLYKISPET
jgi:ERCC4-related helicase